MFQSSTDKLSIITAAILAGEAIQFDYVNHSGKQTNDRIVDPEQTQTTKAEGIKVSGKCRLRSGFREFRIAGMSNVRKYEGLSMRVGEYVRSSTGALYLLARVEPYRVALICPNNGIRYNNGFSTTSAEPYLVRNLIGVEPVPGKWEIVKAKVVVDEGSKTRYFTSKYPFVEFIVEPNGDVFEVNSAAKSLWKHTTLNTVEKILGDSAKRWKEVSSAAELRYAAQAG